MKHTCGNDSGKGLLLGIIVDEEADEGVMAALDSLQQCVVSQIVLNVGVRSGAEQSVDRGGVAAHDRQHQCSSVVIVALVDIKAVLDHLRMPEMGSQKKFLRSIILHQLHLSLIPLSRKRSTERLRALQFYSNIICGQFKLLTPCREELSYGRKNRGTLGSWLMSISFINSHGCVFHAQIWANHCISLLEQPVLGCKLGCMAE